MRVVRQSKADLLKATETKDIVIFGAGAMAMRLLNTVEVTGKIRFFCDNTESRIGSRLYGIDIVSPELLKTVTPEEVIVVVASSERQIEISEQVWKIADFDVYFAKVLVSKTLETVACDLFDNQNKINQVSDMLIDETSRKIYNEVVQRRMIYGTCDFSDLKIEGDEEYFLPQMFEDKAPEAEVIVDCGAYTGDTVERFARMFYDKVKKIWALECGNEQLEQLYARLACLRQLPVCPEVEVLPYAVSDQDGELEFYQLEKANGSFVGANREFAKNDKYFYNNVYHVKCVALDNILPEDEPVTIIKMDVEGSEYAALKGATRIIKKNKPKLAISIYHSGVDFFRLALYLKEIVPEYKFAIRHHKKGHVDTDLYAWI